MSSPSSFSAADLDAVLITSELRYRPARSPAFEAESRATVEFVETLAESPDTVFRVLAEQTATLCQAGSAGVSIADGEVFRYLTIVGELASLSDGCEPRWLGPSGHALEVGAPVLMTDPARICPFLSGLANPVYELLLVPFFQNRRAVGTIWVAAHTKERRFDPEDLRLLTSVSRFAGAALTLRSRSKPLFERLPNADTYVGCARGIEDRGGEAKDYRSFLVELSDMLRPLSDPLEVQAVATRTLGQYLRANRVLFFEIIGPDYIIERDYTDGIQSLAGRYPVASFGHELYEAFLAGRTVVEVDATMEPSRSATERAAFAGIGVRGHVDVPLVKGGKLVGGITVHCRESRSWSEAEVGLVQQTAERTWEAVERARAERALRTSEERFRSLFTAMDEGYCVIEVLVGTDGRPADLRYLLVNPAYELHTGMRDVVGKTVRELLPGYEYHFIERYGRVAATGEPIRFVDHVADLGRWFDVSAFRVGEPAARQVAVLFSNVTARHETEEALRASERQLAEVFRHAPSFMGVLRGPVHVVELVNNQYDRLVGGRPLLGLAVRDALPEVVQQGYVELLDRVYRTGEPFVGTGARVTLEARDGRPREERLVDFVYQPLRDASGQVTGIIVQGIDQTERASAEGSLRESEARFRSLFESMSEGYCVVELVYDPAGNVVDARYLIANPALETHTGLRDVVGKTAREVMPGLEGYWFETYAQVVQTGATVRRVDYVADLGRWYEVSAFPVGGQSSNQVGVLFADVTARKRAEDERQRLVSIVENSHDFIGVFDADGTSSFVNSAGRRMVGLLPDHDVTRIAMPDYVVPDERTFVSQTVLPAILKNGRWTGALTFRNFETGAAVPVLYDLFKLDDARPGRPPNFATVTRDISEQKRGEARLREKDQRLQLFLGAAADYAVVITDALGRVTDWLGGAAAITGFQRDDLVGRPIDLIFTDEDQVNGVPARELATAARNGRSEDKRWHRKKDGDEFFADGVMVAIRGDDGTLRGFGKVFRDATSRKRGEEAVQFLADASASLAELVDYESTLQRIANLAVTGFADWCVVDVLEANGRRRRLALTRAEAPEAATARTDDARLVGDGMPGEGASNAIPHVLRTGEAEVVPDLAALDPLNAPQGEERIARLRGWGVRSYASVPLLSRGQVIGGITFLGTSGRRRFGPEELRVASDVAERVTVAVENSRLYQALQDQDRRKDEFLATLAHELRNPLAPIRNGVQILRHAASGGAAGRALDMMERQLGQLVHLVDDLMDVSRVSSGKVALRPERIDAREVMDAAVETSRQLIAGAQHTLTVHASNEPLWLRADRTRLVQVFSNLLNNAAKYTPAGGKIDLSTERGVDTLVVRVSDTGVGIPAEMLPRVFDMFTQVGSSLERSQGGLGIGLTLVRRLVEMHGGSVSAASSGPGRGSIFTVQLPLEAGGLPERRSDDAPALQKETEVGLTILVVDDNRDAAESLALILEIKGHRVRTAHDGPEALRELQAFRPALIFLDLGLPGMSGYEIARRIRQSPNLGGVRLVALTGWGQEEDRRRTREAGFDHHLVKPADPVRVDEILQDVSGKAVL